MLCIICNENPEKSWPKRWQCWKENGKFSESLCKILGLPTIPYKTDFQNSLYCSPCQKRVYNVYLMVRKWDKLQDDISKLKLRLKKDFQQSLEKSDTSSGEENENEKNKLQQRNDEKFLVNSSASLTEINTVVRKRILKRLDRKTWDCDCCCETDEQQNNDTEISVSKAQGIPGCGFSDCQDQNCSLNWRKDVTKTKDNNYEEDAMSTNSSDWSPHQAAKKCTDEHCNVCFSSEGHHDHEEKMQSGEQNSLHDDAPCSSEFCADCSICKEAARNTRKDTISKNWTDSCQPTSEDMNTESQHETENTPTPTTARVPKLREDEIKVQNLKHGVDDVMKNECVERFRCNRANCTRTFVTQEDLDIHVQRHHEGVKCPYVCQQCDKTFQWRRELNSHVLKHSGEVAIRCYICDRGFRTTQLFNVHLKTKHGGEGERKYKCTTCDKSFISESKLSTHLTIHTKVYPFTCTICDKGFSAKTFLNFHMSKHMEANPYKCTTCSKTFCSPRNLKVHQYTHTKSHPYKCSICQAGTTSETLLKKHMLKHNVEKANACQICNKRFRFPSSLKKHQKVHSGDKQFKCDYCNKTFIDKYKLTRHLRTHSGDFHCTICKQSFTTKEYLNKHYIQSHENELTKDGTCSSSLNPPMELLPINPNDLEILGINDPLSTYLQDGFSHDPNFLEHFNTNDDDDDLVVTALDLEKFAKEELMIMDKPNDNEGVSQENGALKIPVLNSTVLPDFESLRRNSTFVKSEFSEYIFRPL